MTTLYLIRHAEAEGNLYRRAHGHYDSLITDNGYAEIRALKERFADIPVDIVWSSDLFRTMTTARAILEPQGKNLNTHQGLREVNMGAWEDKSWGQLQREYPHSMCEFSESSQDWQAEHGENFEKLTERVGKTITDLVKQHQGKTVAIFSHGLAIRQFLSYVNQEPPSFWGSSPHGDNASVSKLNWDGTGFTIEYSADNSHLSEDISTFARQNWWRKNASSLVDRNLWFEEVVCHDSTEYKEYQQVLVEIWGAEPPASTESRVVYAAKSENTLVGWVSVSQQGELVLLHLKEGYRQDRLGLQLLGQAVSHARSKGLSNLTLHCPPEGNVGFFTKFGFVEQEHYYEKYIGYQPRTRIFEDEQL